MQTLALNKNWFIKVYMVLMLTFSFLIPANLAVAQAQQPDRITEVMCNVIRQLTGNIGRTIAILIVISLAIALFLGKVTWGVAIAVGVGMGVLFGAPGVVTLIAGGADPCA